MKLNILYLAPHLSTGGMPQFLLKRVESLINNHNIFVVEYSNVSNDYVVQRNEIKRLLGNNFFSLSENKKELLDIIKDNLIDIVHLENESEGFDYSIMNELYSNDRKYKLVETCHNVTFNPKDKFFIPDAFSFCTSYHLESFSNIDTFKQVIAYPIEKPKHIVPNEEFKKIQKKFISTNKTNILNVGLWTKNKNQKEGLEIAKANPNAHFHFVGNQAINFKDYWQPLMEDLPSNVTIWNEQKNVNYFLSLCDVFMFNSVLECNPLVLREAISYKLPIYAHNLPQYDFQYDKYILPINELFVRTKEYDVDYDNGDFYLQNTDFYNRVMKLKIKNNSNYKIYENFAKGAYLEIKGNSDSDFKVEFLKENELIYTQNIKCNSWVKLNAEYYLETDVKVYENNILVYEKKFSLKDKNVLINFESSSLGDTLAWLPYCDEFQKKHNCKLFVKTFKNFLFENQYDNITFLEPNEPYNNIYAKYDLGWFYNPKKEPILPNTIPLQQTATNILGLAFNELKPKINYSKLNKPIKENKYVCIAPDSTSGCKEWESDNWQFLVDYLIDEFKYEVVNVSINSKYNLKNVTIPNDLSLQNTMHLISSCDFLIGLSSGLSWLSWSLNKHVYMVANFTNYDHEFQENCTRITNTKVCNGCWNNKNFKFDKGNWNWCPIYEGYEKQFECQKSINYLNVSAKIIENIKNKVH